MLFNSVEFIFLFLPLTLLMYFLFGRTGKSQLAVLWLVICSMFFYGWWNPVYIGLMLFSMLVNYGFGLVIARVEKKRFFLFFAVSFNLALLGYYKYTDFFIQNINAVTGSNLPLQNIMLPLGISFFTFTQTAYLVDVYRGVVVEKNILKYFLFVTYFPHLIAGPILHHKEMMPQFGVNIREAVNARNLAGGIALFSIGIFKKVVLADRIALHANPVFSAAAAGEVITFFEGWIGALSYSLQLYFDFSGYADMAMGASLLFGIRLPVNFNSPYKASSIIDFWRRWHMTLSRFLRDYLYISLGGNRKGVLRRYVNLFATMLLGGIWHGAGWTFLIWGAMHGFYLFVNHLWRDFVLPVPLVGRLCRGKGYAALSAVVTFICVVVAWVFFRAESLDAAMRIIAGMTGINGVTAPLKYLEKWGEFGSVLQTNGVVFVDNLFRSTDQIAKIMLLLGVAWCLPNSQEIMRSYNPATEQIKGYSALVFSPGFFWFLFIFCIFVVSVMNLSSVSEFLYFRF